MWTALLALLQMVRRHIMLPRSALSARAPCSSERLYGATANGKTREQIPVLVARQL